MSDDVKRSATLPEKLWPTTRAAVGAIDGLHRLTGLPWWATLTLTAVGEPLACIVDAHGSAEQHAITTQGPACAFLQACERHCCQSRCSRCAHRLPSGRCGGRHRHMHSSGGRLPPRGALPAPLARACTARLQLRQARGAPFRAAACSHTCLLRQQQQHAQAQAGKAKEQSRTAPVVTTQMARPAAGEALQLQGQGPCETHLQTFTACARPTMHRTRHGFWERLSCRRAAERRGCWEHACKKELRNPNPPSLVWSAWRRPGVCVWDERASCARNGGCKVAGVRDGGNAVVPRPHSGGRGHPLGPGLGPPRSVTGRCVCLLCQMCVEHSRNRRPYLHLQDALATTAAFPYGQLGAAMPIAVALALFANVNLSFGRIPPAASSSGAPCMHAESQPVEDAEHGLRQGGLRLR